MYGPVTPASPRAAAGVRCTGLPSGGEEAALAMGDLEARVAVLEDEKRKLLASWQREREENARKAGACAVCPPACS